MAHPIHVLLDHFFPSLRNIAPEKADELRAIIEKYKITFELCEEEQGVLFQADTANRKIIAAVPCLGRLWATALGYFCFYTEVAQTKVADPTAREVDLKSNQRLKEAGDLLSWTIHAEQVIADALAAKAPAPDVPWPDNLPRPTPKPPHASDLHVADELFLCAAAYILHHELAHFYMEHVGGTGAAAQHQEYEADYFSAEWILEGIPPDDPRFLKRSLGVALALCWLTSLALYIEYKDDEHPPACDRLLEVLDSFIKDPKHLVWAFVQVVLNANLEARKVPYEQDREHSSFRDVVVYYLSEIKKFSAPKKA
jgi:hypothetical protein